MEEHAPSVLTILRDCLLGGKPFKQEKKLNLGPLTLILYLCVVLFCFEDSQGMNLLQRIISIVIYCGHTCKRVSALYEKMEMSFVINSVTKFPS